MAVPRLLAHFWLDAPALPDPLAEIAGRVLQACAGPFNSVGLNLYRDGRDSVAPHHDRLHERVAGQPIVLLSLGACRCMQIRARQPPARRLAIKLEPGSLLSMSYPVGPVKSPKSPNDAIRRDRRRRTSGPRTRRQLASVPASHQPPDATMQAGAKIGA